MGEEKSENQRAFVDEENGRSEIAVAPGEKSQVDGKENGVRWTVFVDNLSRRVSRGALWELFSHHGKVNHVFIPLKNKKPKYRFSTFAFVRFDSEKAMNRAIEKTNKSKIDGKIITVARAKFPVQMRRKFVPLNQGTVFIATDRVGANKKEIPNPIPPEINSKISAGLDSRSFRDVLIGQSKHNRGNISLEAGKPGGGGVTHGSLFDIHIPVKDIAWIDRSLVGVLKHHYDLEFIQRAILSDGLNARVARWGNFELSCIITFNSSEDLDEALNKRDEGLSFWFSHVAPLINEKGVPASYLSVSLVGVPLHCWHESFFKSLGNRWGTFIAIEEDTREMKNFSVAKMIIRAESPFDVPSSLTVRSLDRSFIIKVSIAEHTKVHEEVNVELDGGNFADVWPAEKAPAGTVQRSSDLYSQSSPSDGGVPEARMEDALQNGFDGVELDPQVSQSSKINTPVLGNSLDIGILENIPHTKRTTEDVCSPIGGKDFGTHGIHLAEEGVNPGLCQAKNNFNIPPGFGPNGSNTHGGCSRSIEIANRSNIRMTGYSIESGGKPTISPTFEFVPDSFEGLENVSLIKENSGGLEQCVEFNPNIQCPLIANLSRSDSFGLQCPSLRRAVRLSIRNVLDEPRSLEADSDPTFQKEDSNILDEAVAIWEVSRVLDISFKGGREMVIKRETKIGKLSPALHRKLLYSPDVEMILSPSIGSAGGLISMWNRDAFVVSNQVVAKRFIAISGHLKSLQIDCGFMNIYGPSIEADKCQFFSEITEYLEKNKQPWCVCGDFNAYLHPGEKCGGPVNVAAMDMFRRFLQESCLMDLPLKGGEYTWSNGRDTPTLVRLDRFLVNADFLSAFHYLEQCLLSKSISDHNAIALIFDERNWGPKPFKFFNYYLDEEGFIEMVHSCIQNNAGNKRSLGVFHLLKNVKGAIKDWNKSHCHSPGKSIKALEKEIHILELEQQKGCKDSLLSRKLATLRSALWKELRKKVQLSQGIRYKGTSLFDPSEILKCVHEFFSAAYNVESALEVEDFNLSFSGISLSQQASLEAMFTKEEVWRAICSSDSNKAPGPDGFNMGFFKTFWGKQSWIWNGVTRSFEKNDHFGVCLRSKFNVQLGDEKSINFWNDTWACEIPLRIKFPRIFAVCQNKSGVVADFGYKVNGVWSWNIPLRRQLFDWELEIWDSLLALLQGGRFSNFNCDWLSWTGSGSGKFSVKSVIHNLHSKLPSCKEWNMLIWRGVAPPKVEIFSWLVIRQRIPVRVNLAARDKCSLLRSETSVLHVWEAPPFGFVKINVDGAMVTDGSKGGIRGILRDSTGTCLASFSLPIGPGPAVLAELEAIKHGLELFFSLSELQGSRLILESDCSTVVDWISNSAPCPPAFVSLLRQALAEVLEHDCSLAAMSTGWRSVFAVSTYVKLKGVLFDWSVNFA
ncbi:hypothetical protein GQ457_02G007720 [Hibiscus cannabinus]